MFFNVLLYLYFILIATISFISYKKGVYLVCISILFIPTIILSRWVWVVPFVTLIMLMPICMELLTNKECSYKLLLLRHQVAIMVYIIVSLAIFAFSESVPLRFQFSRIIRDTVFLLFGIQTFLLVKKDQIFSHNILKIICFAVVFNVLYCVIFEAFLRYNPAGRPLYVIMGSGNNAIITDMIEHNRGYFDFRAQTIYAHPLSLGQYFMMIIPLFFMKVRIRLRLLFIAGSIFLVMASGTRSAIFPMVLMFLFLVILSYKKTIYKTLLYIIIGSAILYFASENKTFTYYAKPVIASLQFWDDKKQSENDISGSSMEMRLNQFKAAQIEIKNSPVFGRGYGYKDYWLGKHNQPHPKLWGFESVFLQNLVETGWLGLSFFFVTFLYIYRLFRKFSSEKKIIDLIAFGFLISIVMTGIRPWGFLILLLVWSVACCRKTDKRIPKYK